MLHGPTTPAPVFYVMCIIKPARVLCQGLATRAYYDYNNSARVDKNNKKLKLQGLKNKERIAN